MHFVIAGKNNIAVDILIKLLDFGISNKDIFVICNSDEKGKDGWQKSLRKVAIENDVCEVDLNTIYDDKEIVFLSLEFDKIIDVKRFKSNNLYNIHFSLLPSYKGLYTSSAVILGGEKKTGVTFHNIDFGIDTGDIIDFDSFYIDDDDTSRDVYLKNILYGTNLVWENVKKMIEKNNFSIQGKRQTWENASYIKKGSINFKENIDFYKTAQEVKNQIRALTFREFQLPIVNDKSIFNSIILDKRSVNRPGEVVLKKNHSFIVSTIDYDIELFEDRFDDLYTSIKTFDRNLMKTIQFPYLYYNEYVESESMTIQELSEHMYYFKSDLWRGEIDEG